MRRYTDAGGIRADQGLPRHSAGRDFLHEKGSFHVAKKIGKKPPASKAPAAAAKRPAPLKISANDSRKPSGAGLKTAKVPVKPVKSSSGKAVSAAPVKAVSKPAGVKLPAAKPAAASADTKSTAAKSVVAKSVVAKVAAAVVKPVAAVAKTAASVVKPAKPPKVVIPMAEKSAVVTAYARPGAKPVPPAEVAKKPAKVIDTRPVRLPPPPVRSDSKTAKNRAGLTAKEVEHFRDLLLEKRRELLGDVSSMETDALRSGNSNLSTLPMHMADSGTDNYEQEFTLGLVEKDRQLMREINLALAKIQDGSYGICEGTGKPIAKPRLEAQPWAKYSIEHARAWKSRNSAARSDGAISGRKRRKLCGCSRRVFGTLRRHGCSKSYCSKLYRSCRQIVRRPTARRNCLRSGWYDHSARRRTGSSQAAARWLGRPQTGHPNGQTIRGERRR